MNGANPIRAHVEGSPYQPGERVRVVSAIDTHVHDVTQFIGREGTVDYLDFECGCAQTYPTDPMIGVWFPDGQVEEFWPEEVAPAAQEGGEA